MKSICIFGLVFTLFQVFANQVNSLSLPKPKDVRKMEILELEKIGQGIQNKQPAVNVWLAQHRIFDYLHSMETKAKLTSAPRLVRSFKWDKCDQSPPLMNLTNLSIGPDPLEFPGNLNIQFAAHLKETIDAPLQLKVVLKKEITPTFWLVVPCIEGIGSCTYDDMCETLQGATCPSPFVKYDVPCKCPFPKGSYKMLDSSININVNGVPGGNYHIQADISYSGSHVACLDLYFSIKMD